MAHPIRSRLLLTVAMIAMAGIAVLCAMRAANAGRQREEAARAARQAIVDRTLAQHDADIARAQLRDISRQLADEHRAGELANRQNAELQRQLSDAHRGVEQISHRFDDVRVLAFESLFEIDAAIAALPGAATARKKLADVEVQTLSRLWHDSRDDPDLARQVASAVLKIAAIQSGGDHPSAGDLEAAARTSNLAVEMLRQLAKDDPMNETIERLLANALESQGDLLCRFGMTIPARDSFDEAVKLRQSHDRSDAPLVDRRAMMAVLEKRAQANARMGEYDKAAADLNSAMDIASRHAAAFPADAQANGDVADCFLRLAELSFDSGQWTQSLASDQQAADVLRKSSGIENADMSWLFCRAVQSAGRILLLTGKPDEALAQFEAGLDIAQKLTAADPDSVASQLQLADLYGAVSDGELAAHRLAEASRSSQTSLQICTNLTAAHPDDVRVLLALAHSHARQGKVQRSLGRVTDALDEWNTALAICLKASQIEAPLDVAQRELPWIYEGLADAQENAGRTSEALDAHRKGLEVSLKLASAWPGDARLQSALMHGHRSLAELFQRLASQSDASAGDQLIAWDRSQAEFDSALTIAVKLKVAGHLSPIDQTAPADLQTALHHAQQTISKLRATTRSVDPENF